MPQRFHLRVARPRLSRAAAILSSLFTLAVANIAAAENFDFSEALQS